MYMEIKIIVIKKILLKIKLLQSNLFSSGPDNIYYTKTLSTYNCILQLT